MVRLYGATEKLEGRNLMSEIVPLWKCAFIVFSSPAVVVAQSLK